ncbi:stage V sporulation protein AC [Lutispora sp.]|uniref:stage V sporulation protein AC n=1 Tax=Lutispora sp. TaxID=2828727 RepID=UPI002B1EADC1|nr:stage V sporulation protein AC [Lutispora sp.]MEA4961530.1 stage V sporulation protein AC [Lutispora sp.]
MSSNKDDKLNLEQQKYKDFAQQREPKRPLLLNCLKAFIVGGSICAFGQILQFMYIKHFHFTEKNAGDPTAATLIIISILLTGFGVYDDVAQWAGAGSAVPITGFANTISSAAIEHRSEGYVLGVGGNMFKIAGPVIVYGVFSAFVVSIIKMLLKYLGGM